MVSARANIRPMEADFHLMGVRLDAINLSIWRRRLSVRGCDLLDPCGSVSGQAQPAISVPHSRATQRSLWALATSLFRHAVNLHSGSAEPRHPVAVKVALPG